MTGFICEPLGKQHDRSRFRCGVVELDQWLQLRARQDLERHVAAVYVLVPVDDPVRVAGFYTLSATSIVLTDLPAKLIRKLPRYPIVPAILLGRLARDLDFRGVGEMLLMDALQRAWRNSSEVAAAAIVVDAINDAARSFYQRYGFEPIVNMPQRLFLPIGALEKMFP
jgi:GNAT superfamily N-acetyltransferase